MIFLGFQIDSIIRMAKLVCSTKAAPVGALITARAAEEHGLQISVSWGEETAYSLPGGAIGATHSAGIARSVSDNIFCFNMYSTSTTAQPSSLIPHRIFPSRIQGQKDPGSGSVSRNFKYF
jgi:hypothetical protein